MGLLTILRKIKQKEKEIRVLVLCVNCARAAPAVSPPPPPHTHTHTGAEGTACHERLHAMRRRPPCEAIMHASFSRLARSYSPRLSQFPSLVHHPPPHPPLPPPPPPPRIVRRGLDNAGKTTILKKFNGEDIESISPTLGFAISTLEYAGFKLHVWDVGGQATIRAYWRNYFEATDGVVWVVDSADRRRLRDCREELHRLLGQEKLAGASVVILANKQDLEGALGPAEIAEALGLGGPAFERRHWHIQACSAVTGVGLVEGVDWVVRDIASRIFMAE